MEKMKNEYVWNLMKQEESGKKSIETFSFFVEEEGITQLEITILLNQPSWFKMLLIDPKGKIRYQQAGNGYQNKASVVDDTSIELNEVNIPSYSQFKPHIGSPNTISGKIYSGEWKILSQVMVQEPVKESFGKIQLEQKKEKIDYYPKQTPRELSWQENRSDERFELKENLLTTVLKNEKRWYKGDFHTHTIYSDGKMTREMNVEQAQAMDLDFFVATDHDLMPTSWPSAMYTLVLPGIEITSEFGHYNRLFGLTHPYQQTGYQMINDKETLIQSFEKEENETHLNSVNHPYLTVWKWLAEDLKLGKIDCLEIWNDPTYKDNIEATEMALKTWDRLLSDGYSITGIGGSDSHLYPDETYPESSLPSLLGDPTTYVLAENLSGEALKQGVKAGKVYVSRFGYELTLSVAGNEIGQRMSEWTEEVKAQCSVISPSNEECVIEWVVDGEIIEKHTGRTSRVKLSLVPEMYHYVRVNIRKENGELVAFTNPVYFGEKQPTLTYWKEVLE